MPAEGPLRDRGKARFHLIETLRFEPGEGLLRKDLHFARLARSAQALGFAFSLDELEAALLAELRDADAPKRVRVGLEADGRFSIEARPFVPLADGTVWKLRIAATRLSSSDELLRHKTSLRSAYEAARAEFAAGEADEVLLLNEKGDVCEGTITNVFVELDDGMLATPSLACGLLQGVMRDALLQEGKAVEQVLRPHALRHRRLFVGNSLRGLIEARLVG